MNERVVTLAYPSLATLLLEVASVSKSSGCEGSRATKVDCRRDGGAHRALDRSIRASSRPFEPSEVEPALMGAR